MSVTNNKCNQVRIKSIFISNFRSFAPRNEETEGMNIDNLSAINVFVGPNGSGKTNFINALRDCIGMGRFNSKGTCSQEFDSHKGAGNPTEITIWVETSNAIKEELRLSRDNQSERTDSLKKRIYPIGLPHKFSEFNDIHRDEINESTPKQNRTYAKICQVWQQIREDSERIGVKLQENYPKEPVVTAQPVFDRPYYDRLGPVRITIVRPNNENLDRFFYDVVDNYGVPILEGSDGIANFLLMIVKIRIREPGSVILIEEPEVSMHPRLQKQFLDYLKYLAEKDKYQFLISTHSPYLLNFAVSDKTEEVAVFRISKDEDCTQFKPVKNKGVENWEILTDLGHSPADVLQASCIIWVEGPSDCIYLKHWLTAYDSELKEGLHYSVMFYGGRLLSHLSFDDEEVDEFIDLRKINQNTAILIDSDKKNENGNITRTKHRIYNEFNNGSAPGFAWVTAGREIENYVLPTVMEEAVKSVYPKAKKLASTGQYAHCYYFFEKNSATRKTKVDKIKIAKKVIKFDATLSVLDLKKNIRKLSEFIRQSNGLTFLPKQG